MTVRLLVQAAVCAAVLFGSDLRAAELITTSAGGMGTATIGAQGRRVDRPADPIELQIRVPDANNIELPEGVWEIRVVGDSVWAPRTYLRDSDSVSLQVWPAVPLRVVAKGATALSVAFTPLDAGGAAGDTACRLESGAWNCAIPAARYDLRFSTAGFAPEYRFSVAVPGNLDVPLQFVAGASLSGRLEPARHARTSVEGVEVSLTPTGANARQRYNTKSTAKGFFQFKGLPPGDYAVRARRQGFTAQTRAVTIVAGMAAELNAPLLLDRPKRVTVTIFPSLDPDLQPWRVSLWSFGAGSQRRLDVVSESIATPSGEWSVSGLVGGDYRVHVSRTDGQRWKSEDVHIDDSDLTLPLTVLGEQIHGTVTLGDRPIAAKLSFGGEGGVTLRSDEEGRFRGEVPPDGDGDERMILVDAEELQVVRTVRVKLERTESGDRHVDIRLPATTLIGRVVDADRSPQPNAVITISGAGPVHQAFAGNDGSFQVTGLDPGEYRVSAQTNDGRSEPAPISLSTETAAEVELVLRSQVIVRGRVGFGETPVIQADVYAIPRDTQWAPFMPRARTTERGRFQLELPPRTSLYDLVVVHPAFDLVLTRVPVQPDNVRHVLATQIGGTLVVESRSPADLLLRHGGGECWLSWLADRPGAGGTVESTRVIVPRLEPGQYSVCSAKAKACRDGYLAPYGTLTLAID